MKDRMKALKKISRVGRGAKVTVDYVDETVSEADGGVGWDGLEVEGGDEDGDAEQAAEISRHWQNIARIRRR